MIQLVGCAGVRRGRNEDDMRAIMGEGRGEIKPARAMPGPRWADVGRVVGYNQLACGVNRMGSKVEGLAMDTMPCRTGRVFGKGTEGVKGQLRQGDEGMPAIRGERTMHRCKGRDEVVFCRANGSLGGISAVLVRGNMLKCDILGDEEGRELRGSFVV